MSVKKLTTAQAKEETIHSLRATDVWAPTILRTFATTDQKGINDGTPVGYWGQAALRKEQCDTTEERAVTRLWHSKQLISVTIRHSTEERCFMCGPHR
jgi:hypothetical protein